MHRLLSASTLLLSALLLSACATSLTPSRAEGPQGTVVGVITLPEGVSADNACDRLMVLATNAQGLKLGDSSVHPSRNRCSYTVDYVQANVPVKLAVTDIGGICGQGAVKATNAPDSFQLQERETKLIDLSLTCAQ